MVAGMSDARTPTPPIQPRERVKTAVPLLPEGASAEDCEQMARDLFAFYTKMIHNPQNIEATNIAIEQDRLCLRPVQGHGVDARGLDYAQGMMLYALKARMPDSQLTDVDKVEHSISFGALDGLRQALNHYSIHLAQDKRCRVLGEKTNAE
jgi:hypothetical protein